MASPHAAGVAALIISRFGDSKSQGGAGHNSWYGAGQINALRAVTGDKGN
jgi:hypothetical protein